MKSKDAQRQANRRFHAKREESGLRKMTVWLTPEAREALAALKMIYGTNDAAAEAALMAAKVDETPNENED
jgi:DNA-binding TFAR19-related protein (PDSD5 family)